MDPMTSGDVWNQWPAEPQVFLGLGFLVLAYALALTRYRATLVRLGGPVPNWTGPGMQGPEVRGIATAGHVIRFYLGILIAGLSLGSPLHTIGEGYLLSAHMVQHLIITMIVPPLLITGTPAWMVRPLLRWGPVGAVARTVLTPIPAFVIFNAIFLGWHVPAFYELALAQPTVHAAEHTTMLLAAMITWWPIFGTMWEYPRLPYGGQVFYLFIQSLPPTILGALITLTSKELYPTYFMAERISFLSAAEDQTIAGLIMWIPGALGYFTVLTGIFYVWVEKRPASERDSPFRKVDPGRVRQRAATVVTAPTTMP